MTPTSTSSLSSGARRASVAFHEAVRARPEVCAFAMRPHVIGGRPEVVWDLPGGGVVIQVSDTGCGMTDEVKKQIFDPFFTTKSTSLGTGLGLYICKQIVMAHHGNIWVESVLDRGTTFIIELPADPTL